jgi:hypothetical protein
MKLLALQACDARSTIALLSMKRVNVPKKSAFEVTGVTA